LPQDGVAHVLRQLELPRNAQVLVGAETFDDAGVFRISDDLALVQTVDFFAPLVDDPYDFGRIAAANSLSDVYAMGGEPLTALNIVCFPDKELPIEVLLEILRGGADVCRLAGVVVLGGHSIRDAEVKFGMSVTGRVHPDRILRNVGAKPGDRLVLTKPIGTGVITTAAKQGLASESTLREAVRTMTALNRGACRAALEVGVHACTDVTGFGLIGHAYEMAQGSNVDIVIYSDAVPLLPDALEFAKAGKLTRAYRSTKSFLADNLRVADRVDPALAGLLLDAQTSGGLLLSAPSEHVGRLIAALRREETLCAVEIGSVEMGTGCVSLSADSAAR